MTFFKPFISIIIPCLDEVAYIENVIDQLRPSDSVDYEIIVVDGGSTDGTLDVVEQIGKCDTRIRLIHNPNRIQASGVNLGVKEASMKARFFVRADAHCSYPPGYVEALYKSWIDAGATSVVVPMVTRGKPGTFQECVACAQNSILGNGGAAHRNAGRTSGYVDHGHHAGFDRDFFVKNGGYDESFKVNEDGEYDVRTAASGARIWLNRDAAVTYFPRESVTSLARQYFAYGIGRASTVLKHGVSLKIRQALPVLVTASVTAGIIFSYLCAIFLAIPLGYVIMSLLICEALFCRKLPQSSVLLVAVAAMVMHLAWGAGFLWHAAKQKMRKV